MANCLPQVDFGVTKPFRTDDSWLTNPQARGEEIQESNGRQRKDLNRCYSLFRV